MTLFADTWAYLTDAANWQGLPAASGRCCCSSCC